MKTFFLLAVATLATSAANASVITISLDNPNQIALPGETLNFTGTITNLESQDVYLDGDDVNIAGLTSSVDYTWTDDILNTPYPLGPLAASSDIDLFDIQIAIPFNQPLGTYHGTYTLTGGVGSDGSDNLGQASFSLTVAPEPGTFGLLGTALALMGWLFRARGAKAARV